MLRLAVHDLTRTDLNAFDAANILMLLQEQLQLEFHSNYNTNTITTTTTTKMTHIELGICSISCR